MLTLRMRFLRPRARIRLRFLRLRVTKKMLGMGLKFRFLFAEKLQAQPFGVGRVKADRPSGELLQERRHVLNE